MANVNHSTLTDPYLHEPKGIASAGTGQVYVANGTGSGTWVENHRFLGAYIPFDATTPAYSHSTTTSATVIDPTFTVAESNGFTGTSSPNARLTYTGTEDISAHLVLTLSTKQASGTSRDVQWIIYKNGVELPGSRTIRTISSGSWGSISVSGYTSLSTNDYIEVFTLANSSCTVQYASGFLSIMGVPE